MRAEKEWRGLSLGWTLYPRQRRESQTKGVPETGWVPEEASAIFCVIYFPVLFDNF